MINWKRYLITNYAFAAACLLLFWMGYTLAFNKTVQAYQLNRQLNAQAIQAADVSYPAAFLERKQANLNKLIKNYSIDTISFRMQVMGSIASFAEQYHCRVVAVPADKASLFTTGHSQVQKVKLEGDYNNLLQLLGQAEHAGKHQWVSAAAWQSNELHTSAGQLQRQLHLDLYLSNIADNKEIAH